MKTIVYILFVGFVFTAFPGFGQYSEKDTTSWNVKAYERLSYTNHGETMPYRLLKPKNINPSVKYPLVIMLHGKGEGIGQPCTNKNGINSCNIVWGAKMHLDSIEKYPSFVIFPQCRGGAWENELTLQLLVELMELMFKTYPIDMDRVLIHGISGGGRGIWLLSYRYPSLFAAISPHSASGDTAMAKKLLYTPIWNVQGEIDFIVRPKISVLMFDKFRHLGKKPYFTRNELWRAQEWSTTKDIGYAPVYSVIPSESHVSWPHLYNSSTWLNWLYSQNKNKIQVVGRTKLSPGETTRLGISPGFEAYEWSNGATGNEIIVKKAGTYRVRYKRKQYFFSGPSQWSAWSEPITITYSNDVKPEADAGRDVVLYLPEKATKLRGFAAGAGMTYSWSKLSGPKATQGPSSMLDLNLNNLVAGTYTYRFTAVDMYGVTVYDDVTVYVIDPNVPKKIAGLTLVNADDGSDIMKIANGTVIHTGSLPTKNINIRVDTEPFIMVGGHVRMVDNGKIKVDTVYPYVYFGDANGVYKKGTLTTGAHNFTVMLKYLDDDPILAQFSFSVTNSLLKVALMEENSVVNTEEVKLFPNPVIGNLQMQFNESQEEVVIKVYDQMGSLIKSYEIENSLDEFVLDMQELPTGLYRININSQKFKNKYYSVIKR